MIETACEVAALAVMVIVDGVALVGKGSMKGLALSQIGKPASDGLALVLIFSAASLPRDGMIVTAALSGGTEKTLAPIASWVWIVSPMTAFPTVVTGPKMRSPAASPADRPLQVNEPAIIPPCLLLRNQGSALGAC